MRALGVPLISLPPVSPELNPAERIFQEIRRLPYQVEPSVGAVVLIAVANLRGVRESGTIFTAPTSRGYGLVAPTAEPQERWYALDLGSRPSRRARGRPSREARLTLADRARRMEPGRRTRTWGPGAARQLPAPERGADCRDRDAR